MNRRHILSAILSSILFSPLLPGGPLRAEVDFGDHRSETLTSKAWDAYGRQDYEEALTYAEKCIDMYAEEAKAMQAALDGYPANEPREATSKYWALNDVGTCLYIRGETLMQQGKTDEARQAYRRLVDEFSYAQCWDPKGWFWKPAESAKKKRVELEFDEL